MEEIQDIASLGVKFASAKLDGIQFNEIQKVGTQDSVRTVQKTNPWSTRNTSTPMAYTINAVDIDWNNAVIDENTIIKTTGELLSLIKDIKEHSKASIDNVYSKEDIDIKISELNNKTQHYLINIINLIKK